MALSAIIAYTCPLAHGLTPASRKSISFVCLYQLSPSFQLRHLPSTVSFLWCHVRRHRQTSAPWLVSWFVLDFYFLDMIMWLHMSSIDFSNSGAGGWRLGRDRSGNSYSQKAFVQPQFSSSLLLIPALLLGYNFLSLSADHTVRLLVSLCTCFLLLSRRT
jgi:hypothetical protein